jgi:hypothetical protein
MKKTKQKNAWKTAAFILALLFFALLTLSYYRMEKVKDFKLTEEALKQDLCELYKQFGNRTFEICDLEKNKNCQTIKFINNPCD